MEIAAVHAIAGLAQAESSEVVTAAYAGANLSFGREYLIPKPFDPRLMMRIAPAVAQAAAESGVAARPIADMDAYRAKLQTFVYASGTTMRPIFNLAKTPSTSGSPSPRARRSGCCARCRWWSTRTSPGRP
jgi:malate dehydrogenase (oxaloacetate-decarboxylating)(NADP+)